MPNNIWHKNVQLAVFGLAFALLMMLVRDRESIALSVFLAEGHGLVRSIIASWALDPACHHAQRLSPTLPLARALAALLVNRNLGCCGGPLGGLRLEVHGVCFSEGRLVSVCQYGGSR